MRSTIGKLARLPRLHRWLRVSIAALAPICAATAQAGTMNLAQLPLFITTANSPLVMLNLARDHKLYYEAYNDYSDLDGDGSLDIGYKPSQIDYFGYFDSYKCYTYAGGVFSPATTKADRETRATTVVAGNKTGIGNKKCTNQWSGDFLNYVTTARMDALRKVLYGGYRSTDTTTSTILERTFIPQDAHAWGKEYASVARDGYDIADYAPFTAPTAGSYHVFANVTLTGVGSPPLMRVLSNTNYRVWEWVSIERPVAGTKCLHGGSGPDCVPGGGGGGASVLVPASAFTNLKKTTWKNDRPGGAADNYADNAAEFDNWIGNGTSGYIATATNLLENAVSVSQINCPNDTCNPAGRPDNFVTQIKGKITAPTTGTYTFIIDGDDAIDVKIGTTVVVGWYGGHGFAGTDANSGTINLTAGQTYDIEFRHQEQGGGSGYTLKWIVPNAPTPAMTDYTVRVEVCKKVGSTDYTESNCKAYGSGSTAQKPTGLLQNYGESDGMFFGMISGSYVNNTQGGVLRKRVSSITNEINAADGTFVCKPSDTGCTPGIIGTIDRLRVTSFDYGSYAYSCGWITDRAMNNGECRNWGNPLGEMVYESIRYFAGKNSPTAAFTTGVSNLNDDGLGLPLVSTWGDPYGTNTAGGDGNFPICAKPYTLAISDNYPSFDSDTIPGTPADFNSSGVATDLTGMNFTTLGQEIWNLEFANSKTTSGGTKSVFIGQSGATFDSSPTLKSVNSFATIRGLAPGEPTRQGSYSTAAMAYYAHTTNFRGGSSTVRMNFFSVALASPLPNIIIPIKRESAGGKITQSVTLVPFAKSVGDSANWNGRAFQPTNQIVDFYVESVTDQDGDADTCGAGGKCPKYVFRINYEDVEQGADHDMDAIVKYTVELFKDTDNKVKVRVNLSSDYAAGGIVQHMGYVISGTGSASDGVYLDVRDVDTGAGSDFDYSRDTPDAANLPAGSAAPYDGTALPLNKTRVFTPDANVTTATTLRDPLWYAAKFGGFTVKDADFANPTNSLVADTKSWDADNDGVPDNYFLVVNPLKLQEQLGKAFDKINQDSGSSSAVASNSTSLLDGLRLYVGRFIAGSWSGELTAYPVDPATGTLGSPVWEAHKLLKPGVSRAMITYDVDATTKGIPFLKSSMTSTAGAKLLDSLGRQASGSVDAAQTADHRINWLRGGTRESWTRDRPCLSGTSRTSGNCVETLLGDIITSSVKYVGAPSVSYRINDGTTRDAYLAFRSANVNRSGMVYVGANDGMLHGFDAATGTEKLAYIPSEMYRARLVNGVVQYRLSKLVQPDYGQSSNAHAYFVDGSPSVAEVCYGGACTDSANWKTLLVGGLNGGGQGIYALNVTSPSSLSESNASSIVAWEFNDWQDDNSNGVGDADSKFGLGYTYGQPIIAQVCTARDTGSTAVPKPCTTSKHAVILGNGYNNTEADGAVSTSGHAILYVLDTANGRPLAKLNTKAGSSGAPNGIANVTVVDVDNDGVIDYVYGGDLLGNMWKFDLTQNTPSAWKVAYGTVAAPLPLYTAKDASGTPKAQPISTAPSVRQHPFGGLMVNFGTGKYLETGVDQLSTGTQTLYGIWDNGASLSTATRTNLQQQTMLSETGTFDGKTTRTVSNNAVNWGSKSGWYLDLTADGSTPSERIVSDTQLLAANVLFATSIVPSGDPCKFGGTSFNYFVNPITGGRLDFALFPGAALITLSGGQQVYASSYQTSVGIATRGLAVGGRVQGFIYQSGSTSGTQQSGGSGSGGSGEGGGGGGGSGTQNCGNGNKLECAKYNIPADQGRVSWREITTE